MEDVKNSETLHTPDIRRTALVVINRRNGTHRPFSFSDIEARVGDIPIPPKAPDEIKDLLVTAKNLLLYSWYYYPFTMAASLQSSIALEQALRLKMNRTKRDTLAFLLKEAVKNGLIKTDGFRRWTEWRNAFARLHRERSEAKEVDLAELLAHTLPQFRNTLAHGNRFIDDTGFLHLDIACEAIEQLYPDSPAGAG